MNRDIIAVDIINFKKLSEFLTGKSFNLRSDRDYGKYKEVVDDLLLTIRDWMEDIDEGIVSEKKSNPSDDVFKASPILIDEKDVFPKTIEVKGTVDVQDEKKAKIAMLKEIATGNGLKKADSFIVEKTPLEERYNFEEGISLPANEYRVIIGTKGIAFTDMYDSSFFYLKHEHRYLRFSDIKEFDKFVKQEGILL